MTPNRLKSDSACPAQGENCAVARIVVAQLRQPLRVQLLKLQLDGRSFCSIYIVYATTTAEFEYIAHFFPVSGGLPPSRLLEETLHGSPSVDGSWRIDLHLDGEPGQEGGKARGAFHDKMLVPFVSHLRRLNVE